MFVITRPEFIVPVLLLLLIAIAYLQSKGKAAKDTKKSAIPTTLSRREALESAEVAWGLWHTGNRMFTENLLEMPSLKRVLILEPNQKNQSIGIVAKKSKLKESTIINQIIDTTDAAIGNGVDVRWYFKDRADSFTIYDPTPIMGDGGIYRPFSENATIYWEYFQPNVGLDQRKGHWIYNKGKDKGNFKAYCREYEDIWNDPQKSVKAEKNRNYAGDKMGTPTIVRRPPPPLQELLRRIKARQASKQEKDLNEPNQPSSPDTEDSETQ